MLKAWRRHQQSWILDLHSANGANFRKKSRKNSQWKSLILWHKSEIKLWSYHPIKRKNKGKSNCTRFWSKINKNTISNLSCKMYRSMMVRSKILLKIWCSRLKWTFRFCVRSLLQFTIRKVLIREGSLRFSMNSIRVSLVF